MIDVERIARELRDHPRFSMVKEWLGTGSLNFFGRPFAGKDTQAEVFARLFGGHMLSGGDILRNRWEMLPQEIREALDRGELIPNEAYLETVVPYLSQSEFANGPLMLSSVGRYHGEEESILAATEESGHPLRAVIWLEVDESTIRFRHQQVLDDPGQRGERADDAVHVLDNRIREYEAKTMPVLDFYGERQLLVAVDANPETQDVAGVILDQLYEYSLVKVA